MRTGGIGVTIAPITEAITAHQPTIMADIHTDMGLRRTTDITARITGPTITGRARPSASGLGSNQLRQVHA